MCSYTLNPYRGCQHACQYCYVQSEKYLPFSNIEEFSKTIQVKVNAPQVLKKELSKLRDKAIVAVGSATDPYQPVEQEYRITRKVLDVLNDRNFPCHILTKSDLVLRDVDILSEISKKSWCVVSFTITTLDANLVKMLEPRAPSPERRLQAIKKLSDVGIVAGVTFMPIIPYLCDTNENLEKVVKGSAASGAKYVIAGGMTLRDNQKIRFVNLLKTNFPKLIKKYEKLYGDKISPDRAYETKIEQKVADFCKKYRVRDRVPKYIPSSRKIQTKIDYQYQ
ncbi:MAG: radical SAM protein [Euryarchaeota archaeon]|nr:radical SAM protein [Euryarchaeota archaeon]